MAQERAKAPTSAEELLRRYAADERSFLGANLEGANLEGANLEGANLEGASLERANLKGANLIDAYLRGTNLRAVYLSGANLENTSLEGASLERANLKGASLRDAYLRDTNLRTVNLSGANLRGAKLEGAYLERANLERATLASANLERATLASARLKHANLEYAKLERANLERANLERANLERANLERASLRGANLRGANLERANLERANLERANLERAYLERANLEGANLEGANLRGAELSNANLRMTFLVDLDVSTLCDASSPVHHSGPSTVDFRAILKSLLSPNLAAFLQKTGMPEVFVTYNIDCARSLQGSIFSMLQSTFISYGGPDEAFARKLYEALHRNGVTTFFFPEHATPGEKLHDLMRKGVNEHDRIILVCSEKSLIRPGVLNEIEQTLAREARDGGASYSSPYASTTMSSRAGPRRRPGRRRS